jgi:hypothetical protein
MDEKPSLIETEKFTFYVTSKADFDGPESIYDTNYIIGE